MKVNDLNRNLKNGKENLSGFIKFSKVEHWAMIRKKLLGGFNWREKCHSCLNCFKKHTL